MLPIKGIAMCCGMETNFQKGTGPETRRMIIVEDKDS